jgi:hypothetical protein
MRLCWIRCGQIGLLLAIGWLLNSARAFGQEFHLWSPEDLFGRPRVPLRIQSFDDPGAISGSPSGAARLQMLGMPAGFIVNPIGITDDDDPPAVPGSDRIDTERDLYFSFGSYNPYLDLRRPGDPGGVGYTKIYSQLQLFDVGRSCMALGLQAYTPAGIEMGGVANGPSYVVPALAWFQDLGNGAGLQSYIGQNIHASPRFTDRMNTNFHYGVAFHCPVPGTESTNEQGLFFYLQALGRYRFEDSGSTNGRPNWEFVPGIQWRLNGNCWMSVGASRYNFLSCFWKF